MSSPSMKYLRSHGFSLFRRGALLEKSFLNSYLCQKNVVPEQIRLQTRRKQSNSETISCNHNIDLQTLSESAYIHLPFCRRRCHYCDFPIVPVGERTSSKHVVDRMENYVNEVCLEIQTASLAAAGTVQHNQLKTVFFGGGTPSLVPTHLLTRILETLDREFGISSSAEVSIEMDPGTFDQKKLTEFVGAGVNRVSVGIQSFQSELLKACGRAHGLAEVRNAIDAIHSVGVSNWSLDLISSLPGQSMDMWKESLDAAIEAQPSHVSVYDLQIEEGTAFGRWYKPGEGPLPSNEVSAEMYQEASSKLTQAGFEHYEVSNFAKPGYRCHHNMVYWRNKSYFGFGLGAASYIGHQRFTRPKKLDDYSNWVSDYVNSSGVINWPADTDKDLVFDYVMLSMRLADGLNLQKLVNMCGRETIDTFFHTMKQQVDSGHVIILDGSRSPIAAQNLSEVETLTTLEDVHIRLSDPEGFLFSNEIISSMLTILPDSVSQ